MSPQNNNRLNDFLENIEIQVQETKKMTTEERKKEFERILGVMESYKNNNSLNNQELEEFQKKFTELQNRYNDVINKNQNKLNTLKVNSQIGDKVFDNFGDNVNSKIKEALEGNSIESFKKALDMVVQIGNLEINKNNFPGLTEKDLETLKKSMPAVRGITGAYLLENIHQRGYEIKFSGQENEIILKRNAKNNDSQIATEVINAQIKQNPELGKIIREGLLFIDGDLHKYTMIHSDTNGKNIPEEALKKDNFVNYLNAQKTSGTNTWITDIITKNPNVLKDIDLVEMVESTQHFTPILQKEAEKIQKKLKNKQEVNQSSSVKRYDTSGPVTRRDYEAIWDSMPDGEEWEKNPIGSAFIAIAKGTFGTLNVGLKDLSESLKNIPEGAGVGMVLATILSMAFFGIKDTVKMLGLLTVGGLAYKHFNEDLGVTKSQSDNNNKNILAQNDEKNGKPQSSDKEIKERLEKVKIFYNVPVNDLNKYFKNGGGNLTDEQKELLKDPQIKEDVKTTLDKVSSRTKEEAKKLGIQLSGKEIEELLGNTTLGQANELDAATPEQLAATEIKILKELLEQITDPELRKAIEDRIEALEKGNAKGSWLSTLTWGVGGAVVMGAVGLKILSIILKTPIGIVKLGLKGAKWGWKNKGKIPKSWEKGNEAWNKWKGNKGKTGEVKGEEVKNQSEKVETGEEKTELNKGTEALNEMKERVNKMTENLEKQGNKTEAEMFRKFGKDLDKLNTNGKSGEQVFNEIRENLNKLLKEAEQKGQTEQAKTFKEMEKVLNELENNTVNQKGGTPENTVKNPNEKLNNSENANKNILEETKNAKTVTMTLSDGSKIEIDYDTSRELHKLQEKVKSFNKLDVITKEGVVTKNERYNEITRQTEKLNEKLNIDGKVKVEIKPHIVNGKTIFEMIFKRAIGK